MATAPDISLQPPEDSVSHNEEAEASVLGAILLDGDTVATATRALRAECFYGSAHRLIFQAMEAMYDRNRYIEILTLTEELKRNGTLEAIGGNAFLGDLMQRVPSTIHIEHYANIVKENAIVRTLAQTARQILEETRSWKGSARQLLDTAEQKMFEVAHDPESSEAEHISTILKETMAQIDSWHQGKVTGVETGFRELDEMTTGLQPSQLVIVAARPSMGKTTLAVNMAEHIGVVAAKPVAFFSLETSKTQVVQNMLCSHARIDAHRMRGGFLNKTEWSKLSLATGTLADAPIYIDDTPGISILELKSKARALKAKYNIQVLMVDYLQLMEGPATESRQQEITAISRALKGLARELDVVVVALSQLSRAVESREGNKPRMSDLRESGSIEQEADIILLLYRDEYYNPEKNPGLAQLLVAKQRNGPTGAVTLTFLKEVLRFGNCDTRMEDPA